MASSSAAASAPSTFARLLRRSKASSFDPAVDQVYTTYGGYKHRGDWGFKHRLPATSAGGKYHLRFAALRSFDSPEGQTDFRPRERETLFVKRWHETGAALDDDGGRDLGPRPYTVFDPSTRRLLPTDKEVVAGGEAKLQEVRSTAGYGYEIGVFGSNEGRYAEAPIHRDDLRSMSQREFRAHLERMRQLRPAFKKYLASRTRRKLERKEDKSAAEAEAEAAEVDGTESTIDMWQGRLDDSTTSSIFLSALNSSRISNRDDTKLPQSPLPAHPHGGLAYSRPDPINTQLISPPVPGRALHVVNTFRSRSGPTLSLGSPPAYGSSRSTAVGIAGTIAQLDYQHREGVDPVDWTRRDSSRGESTFRILSAQLVDSPPGGRFFLASEATANPNSGFLEMRVRAVPQSEAERPNVHLPGSPEYVANERKSRASNGVEPLDFGRYGVINRLGRSSSSSPLSGFYTEKEMERARSRRQRKSRSGREMNIAGLDAGRGPQPGQPASSLGQQRKAGDISAGKDAGQAGQGVMASLERLLQQSGR